LKLTLVYQPRSERLVGSLLLRRPPDVLGADVYSEQYNLVQVIKAAR